MKINHKRLAAVIEKLKAWRAENGLSQVMAAEALVERGVPVRVETMRRWECGDRRPSAMATALLEAFFERYPRVEVAPRPGRWPNAVSAEQAEEIRALRAGGMTLPAIGERYGISESSVSRICSTKPKQQRRAKALKKAA